MNFLDGLAETVNRAFCAALAPTVNQADLLQYILTPGFGQQYNPFPTLYAQNCPLTPPIVPSAGFNGGQCPVSYTVSTTYRQTNNGTPGNPVNNTFPNIPGTIKGIERFQTGTTVGVRIRHGLPGNPSGVGFSNVVSIANATPNNVDVTAFSITSVTRTDGQPDNCGNPPAPVTPPTPGYNIRNDNVTYNNTNNVEVTIPVVLVFGYATLNVDGTISVPINATFTANPEFDANFNFNLNTGDLVPDFSDPSAPLPNPCNPPGGFTPDPTIPPPPSSIPDPSPNPPPTDEPTERRELLAGCIVTTTVLDGNETTIFQQENPDIYVPATGYVMFRIRVGNVSAWTNDIAVKNLRCFIPCPWDGGAIEVKGSPRFGNVFVVTPIYVTQTFNPTYPPPA